jgi:hypothetical protein
VGLQDLDPLLWGAALVGVIIGLIHVVLCHRRKVSLQLPAIFDCVLSCLGIQAAVKVFILAFTLHVDKTQTSLDQLDRIYFCLGGIALAWVSVEQLVRRFATCKAPPPAESG